MIEILFENKNLIAVNKPSGWLSVPSRDRKDARKIVGLWLQEHLRHQVFPIHRLDFEVSGILLFAKDAESHRRWQDLFQSREVQKTYHAVTSQPDRKFIPEKFQNIFQEPDLKGESTWECRLEKGKRRVFEANYGKNAITRAKVLKTISKADWPELSGFTSESFLLWELEPVTGRSHQLRYELFRHGCPILGDTLYGSPFQIKEGISLRHVEFNLQKEVDGLLKISISSFS